MKNLLLILLICSTPTYLFAQFPTQGGQKKGSNIPGTITDTGLKGNGKITGTIQDAESKAPVEFATVALLNRDYDKALDGTTTDEKGKFTLSNIPTGNYKLVVSFVGYQNKIIDSLKISDARWVIQLGNVAMTSTSKQLDEITVEGQQELVEDKVDRIVYNADKDITNKGGTGEDVLRKVPMLSVDIDGNVQLRGSSNIRVLINNKPSAIMASSVADAIRQIPADMIKSVEVITNPSAKYDAEGTAGIINIITKKNTLQGVSGSANLSGGTRSSNLFSNLNYKQKKLGLSLNAGGNTWYPRFEGSNLRENYLPSGVSLIDQQNSGNNWGLFGNVSLGADYEIDTKNTLSTSVRFGKNRFENEQLLNTIFDDPAFSIFQQFSRDINSLNRTNTLDVNLDYTRTFKKPQQELSMLALYSRSNGVNRYDLDQLNTLGEVDYREKNDNKNTNEEITFQLDYVHPIKKIMNIELGAKTIIRNVNSDFQFNTFSFTDGAYINIPERSNIFNYDQDVMSAYATWGWNTKKKFGVRAGLRYEHTEIAGDFISTDTRFTQQYDNLIPSLTLSQDLKKGQKLKLSYTRRIQRPLIFFLNPFVNYADAKNISYGNPTLDPELTDSYEFSFNAFSKKGSYTASLFWRSTNNAIGSVRFVDTDGVAVTTFDNIAKNNNYGISLFGSYQFNKAFRLSGNANIFWVTFDSPELQNDNANIAYNFNFNGAYTFNKGWSAQLFGFINSPRVELQGTQGAFSFYTIGVRKELFKKKGGLTLGIDNPFRGFLRIRSNFEDDTFKTENIRDIYNRAVRLTFNYQFGKLNFNEQRPRRKKINNDDVKQGDSQQN